MNNPNKRKRKNRTAFTANQIYELERRFNTQRYLSPHDRDRIAYELSLSTAQVITWFQNRRAKQKRDFEELKNDVNAAKTLKVIDADLDVEKIVLKNTMDSVSSSFYHPSYQFGPKLNSNNSGFSHFRPNDANLFQNYLNNANSQRYSINLNSHNKNEEDDQNNLSNSQQLNESIENDENLNDDDEENNQNDDNDNENSVDISIESPKDNSN